MPIFIYLATKIYGMFNCVQFPLSNEQQSQEISPRLPDPSPRTSLWLHCLLRVGSTQTALWSSLSSIAEVPGGWVAFPRARENST